MKILILSDLHRELWREHAPRFDLSISQPDVVVLAGDIDTGTKAVAWAAESFVGLPVLYVMGNHESYGHNIEGVEEKIQAACDATSNVHFLNCGEHHIGDVRFLGATLWTDFCLFGDARREAAIREAEACMNDYRRIRLAKAKYRKLRASDTAKFHFAQKSWLAKKLDESFDGKTVVITHMAPSMKSVSDRFADDLFSAAYASSLEDMAAKATIWIHGHTHDSFDYQVEQCRVVCNPCGYMTRGGGTENAQFDPNFTISI